MSDTALAEMYQYIEKQAAEEDAFAKIRIEGDRLLLEIKDCESEAYYFVDANSDPEKIWVGISTPDRWLSESIEADLMHRGDDIEELLEDELHDQGWETSLDVQHYRDDEKQYIFRSAVRIQAGENYKSNDLMQRIRKALLAYEACFRELGDVCEADDIV